MGCLERQIRVEGSVVKVSSEISDAYFANRPRESQIGAWASNQSSAIENRAELEERVAHFEEKFKGLEVPRPENWGGYLLSPNRVEFWQGRPNRLHDRILYQLIDGEWSIDRLSP